MDHLSVAPEKPVQLSMRPAPAPTRPSLAPGDRVRTLNYDDLKRSRSTTFFRFFMAVPHLLWLGLWGQGMILLAPIYWIATLVKGTPPEGLRDVYAMFVRYSLHVYAFWLLAAEPFPGFLGKPNTYVVDLDVPPNGPQSRWSVGFRLLLAIPAGLLASSLTTSSALVYVPGAAFTASIGAWFFILAAGRMPQGVRDLIVWAYGYSAQVSAYLFLLTPRYPNSDPAVAPLAPLPAHPVRLELTDELRRNRWLVGFRYVLAMPHFVWWTLWTALAIVVAALGWLVALFLGRLPRPLHRFLAAWVRYSTHFNAFYYLGGGLFPGFVGREGSYPVDIAIDPPQPQPRWTILVRVILALPPLVLTGVVLGVVTLIGFGAWFFAIITGRMPRGLRNTIAYAMRYASQTFAYLVLVTPRYPYSGPADFRR